MGIFESTAGDDVDPNEHHHRHDEDYVGLPPFSPQVPQQSSLASVAVVAQLALVIVPQVAVWVRRWVHGVQPQRRVHIIVATNCWRLTAP